MIDDKLNKIKNLYETLNNKEKDELNNILDSLLKAKDINSGKEFQEISSYLTKKLKTKASKDNHEVSVKNIRNYLFHYKYLPKEIEKKLYDVIWNNLHNLKTFNDISELDNFLSYILKVKIDRNVNLRDKKKLVKMYKKIFDSLEENDRAIIFKELSQRVFAELSKDEINIIFNVTQRNYLP